MHVQWRYRAMRQGASNDWEGSREGSGVCTGILLRVYFPQKYLCFPVDNPHRLHWKRPTFMHMQWLFFELLRIIEDMFFLLCESSHSCFWCHSLITQDGLNKGKYFTKTCKIAFSSSSKNVINQGHWFPQQMNGHFDDFIWCWKQLQCPVFLISPQKLYQHKLENKTDFPVVQIHLIELFWLF